MVQSRVRYGSLLYLLSLLISIHETSGQSSTLRQYISQALDDNLALKQKYGIYERSIYEKKEAQAHYYPGLDFNARYTVAEGGRTIDFPVGDLLNPVYQTLNSLTETSAFPIINNESFYFFRPTEQVTALELRQPIFNPQIYYNVRIRSALSDVNKADYDTYRRFLVGEIQKAYYDYLKTVEIQVLYANTRNLLAENIRVNEKLFENDKVTIDAVYRSRSELSKHDQLVAEAEKYNRTTKAYFNFLLNRELDEQILIDSAIHNSIPLPGLQELISLALADREELKTLEHYQEVTGLREKMQRSNKLPKVAGALDYGIQGVDYDLSPDDDFLLASIVLQWDLFGGLQNQARIQQARIDQDIIKYRHDESRQMIELEVIEKYFDLQASRERIEANRMEVAALKKAFVIIQKKYSEGQASLLEFIDARTSLTRAEQTLILTRYDHLIEYAELERAACLYPLEPEKP